MKRNERKAFKALQKMGLTVLERDTRGFAINTDAMEITPPPGDHFNGNYPYVHSAITDVMRQFNCSSVWEYPGCLRIFSYTGKEKVA